MSEALSIDDSGFVDQLVVAQLGVFQLVAQRTANTLDDLAIGFLLSNDAGRVAAIEWLLSLFPSGEMDPSRLPLMSAPETLTQAANAAGFDFANLLPALVKYGPALLQIIKLFRSFGG